ncbi:erythrocyte membrane protein 1, PfEMP1, putative [Plasmodium sp. gorilla clade G2]|uniref:erythrocyte membrane protein 1, PfEMP1, putative n=1 Tax=Plasmodium sp. gorilla clade G2 TaxID=880535 RepID=UPI000D2C91CF|nr:erythrocyte membrane protein 1, PfEMP1, putative [Plasmodium sp. gorilla clade G2]SOV20161.1 erythrocyte membrane protein 1, PfEMP1, putative [Plasmodium sp. gorilla clade G2]
MGAEQSNTKSSLLKNFTYLIDNENKNGRFQPKLMYFDYLNFLLYEIEHKAWNWKIYSDYVEQHGKGGTLTGEEKLFCGWKEIQEQIFHKLDEQIKPPNQKKYNWTEHALPLINIGGKKSGIKEDCKKKNIDIKAIKELQSPIFPALPGGTSSTYCIGLKTSKDIHVPLRRRTLLVEEIHEYLKEISEKITNRNILQEVIEGKLEPATQRGNVAVSLKKEMIDGLSIEFSKLINEKYKDTEHDKFCKEWQRTMDDYHTLFLGEDIVDENESKGIQCSIKQIESKVGGKAIDFKKEWSKHFKTIVQELWKKKFHDRNTNKPCDISSENKTQCIRFFEEWAEEFCKLKKELGDMIVTNCKNQNNSNSSECTGVCNIYEKFLKESQPYYDNYKNTCMEQKYGYDDSTKDLLDRFIQAVSKSMNECCKDYGDCNDQELFQLNNDKSNIRYKCFCKEGKYYSKQDSQQECKQILNTGSTVQGRSLPAQSLASMSQSGVSSSAACGANSGGKGPSATVSTIATAIQTEVNKQATTSGKEGTDSKGELRAELKEAKFGKTGTKLTNGDACSLQKDQHTNDERTYDSTANGTQDGKHSGPCTGKGGVDKDRFKIGKQWKPHDKVDDKHKGILFPPRRLDMCTSNLENLNTKDGSPLLGDKAKESLLGDVLLAAKEEAQSIIDLYKEKNQLSNLNEQKDKETVCRSMKASFADIGDIIRGRDIWTKESGNKQLQERLVKIFEKIKGNTRLRNIYKDGDPYTEMRKEWWELNRDQVWQAMLCAKDGGTSPCDDTSSGSRGPPRGRGRSGSNTPFDDYIPQKLRWLTEWAEWFCKAQKEEYNKVKQACNGCKDIKKGETCTNCAKCKEECGKYQKFIEEWKKDWETQQKQYKTLYEGAKSSSSSSSGTIDENQKYLDLFLNKLQQANSGKNTIYDSAEGYVQKEAHRGDCNTQNEFCENKTGGTNDKYVFLPAPSDYKVACECDSSTPCDVVKTLMEKKDQGAGKIDGCNKKEHADFDCSNNSVDTTNHNGACMPGRRRKLCVNYLKSMKGNQQKDLREAFIKTGAAETNLLWDKYKTDNSNKTTLDQDLKEGKIPEEFKRIMMYTFGDLKDLCLNTDISVNDTGKNPHVEEAKNKITTAFSKINNGQNSDDAKRNKFWETNGPLIWEGMLCGLSHAAGGTDQTERAGVKTKLENNNYKYGSVTFGDGTTTGVTLSTFVARPQFLRWMTEWGEQYCVTQAKEYHKVETACKKCNPSNPSTGTNGKSTCDKKSQECSGCEPACQKYQQMVTKWEGEWKKQKGKYEKLYKEVKQNGRTASTDQETVKYLKTLSSDGKKTNYDSAGKYLKEEGYISECQVQKDFASGSANEYAFKDYPHTYTSHCTCEQKPPQKPKCTNNKILDAANIKQYDAENEVHQSGIRDKLRGNLSQAQFGKRGKDSKLKKEEVCSLKKDEHTNDVRHYTPNPSSDPKDHQGPCTGKGNGKEAKDQRFIIGQSWEEGGVTEMRQNHDKVLLPPRRKHMCTSNLENLGASGQLGEPLSKVENSKFNHSFLGDVLLAAKFEGDDIVHKLSSKSDIPGICNAMKYSFADLGDIIRGRDLWSKNKDMAQLETHLKAIFAKIYESDTNIKTKYKDTSGGKYTTLREAWWSANRDQVWKALTCTAPAEADLYIPKPKSVTGTYTFQRYKCGRDSYVPPDDYIPQKLRWMTEWSESYCKQLERNFWWVKAFCQACKKAKHTSKDTVCERCRANCKVYKEHVNKWKDDWEKQQRQYEELYNGTGSTHNDDIKKEHENFLKTVKENNKNLCDGKTNDTNEYKSLSDYVTSMGGSTYCNDTTQKKFEKDTKNGSDDSVFKEHPNKYDTECKDDDKKPNTPTTTPKPTAPEKVCETVKECIEQNEQQINSNNGQGYCNEKKDPFNWECDGNKFKDGEGPCMPPRRQKLCVHYLKDLNGSNKTTDDLRQAFIKCAALETYFAWKKYKEDKKKEKSPTATNLHEQLKNGNIPDDFLRSMFFTYGDFMDLCLDKDIGKTTTGDDVDKARKNIDNVFKPKNGKPNGKVDETEREKWWDEKGLDIWHGMVCALSHTVGATEKDSVQAKLLENYKYDSNKLTSKMDLNVLYSHTTPQFLRWYTEWSEEFCDKQKKEFAQLYSKCNKCNVKTGTKTCDNETECKECKKQCSQYTNFINKWKSDWDKQNQHYNKVKNEDPYKDAPLVDSNTPAHEYLYESLELFGLHDNCMKTASSQPQKSGATTGVDMPQALDQYPPDKDEYEKKCECQEDTKPGGGGGSGGGSGPQKPQSQKEECKIEEYIKENDQTKAQNSGSGGGCNEKDFKNKNWDCKDKIDEKYRDGPCMSPRRQSLCIHYLSHSEEKNKINKPDDLKNNVMKSAALETYFLWEQYKGTHSAEAKKLKDGEIPPEFLRMMFYTIGDFKDLITGKDLGILSGNNTIEPKVKDILSKQTSAPKEPKNWWNTIEKEVWEAMLCSLTHPTIGGKDEIKTKYKYDEVKFGDPTTGVTLNHFASRPQFLRWMTEWYDDYCQKKHTKLEAVKNTCKPSSSELKCDDTCDEKCGEYTKFMEERKTHWEKQQGYYTSEKQKSGQNKDYTEPDATKYLQKNFTVTCGDNSSGATPQSGSTVVEENIDALTQVQSPPPASPIYDVDVYCGCKKFIGDDQEYTTISGQSNCKGLMSDVNGTNGKKIEWKHKSNEHGFTNMKDLSTDVFFPSRRLSICFQDIDSTSNNVNNKEELRKQLMKVASTEGYNLGQYYKKKKEKEQTGTPEEQKKYAYDVSPCNAMKYSFLDLRDIIIGTDNLEPPENGTEKNLNKVFSSASSSGGQTNSVDGNPGSPERQKWWNDHEKCVWKAMLCGYKKGRDDNASSGNPKPSEEELKQCDQIPQDSDYPLGNDRASGKNLQFLRWFAEWGEDFCKKYHVELGKLEKACQNFTCGSSNGNQQQCQDACKVYQKFIEEWKKQYDKQKKKYDELKGEDKYKNVDGVSGSTHAYQYLDKSLKKSCPNSGTTSGNCNCMGEKSSQTTSSSGANMPKSLDDVTKTDYKNQCNCNNPRPPNPPKPMPNPNPAQGPGQNQDSQNPTSGKNIDTKGQDPDSQTPSPSSPGSSTDPKQGKNPDSSGGTQPSGGQNPGTTAPENMNCVEKAANKIREEVAVNKVDSVKDKLQGSENHGVYTTKQKDDWDNSEICTITPSTGQTNTCKNNENPFDDKNVWDCNNDKLKVANQHICLPPRRKHMCLTPLETIDTSTTTTSDALFKEVLRTAANEGKHLKDKWEQTKNTKMKKTQICDAMKYSFADLGDIIRGRDKYTDNNSKIEDNLKKIFENIKTQVGGGKYTNGKSEDPPYKTLREHWWTANRDKIWEAMTCSAPHDANIFIKKQQNGTNTEVQYYCGHKSDPPVDDFIPQPLRWINEWSQAYCNAQNSMLETMKNCENCKNETNVGCKQKVHGSCKECKEKCDKYKDFVDKWKTQYDILKKSYENIYQNGTTTGKKPNSVDENTKKFVEKLQKNCQNIQNTQQTQQTQQTQPPDTLDKYLDKGNNCKKFTFDEKTSNGKNYAFETPPNFFKDHCGCAQKFEEVDQCPVEKNHCDEYGKNGTYRCPSKSFNRNPIEWTSSFVNKKVSNYDAVMVPPRRRHLCFKSIKQYAGRVNDEKKFKKHILDAAYNEAKNLWEIYSNDQQKALEAMKYSFADIGNIIKGDDMLDDDMGSGKVKEIFKRIQEKENKQNRHSIQNNNGIDDEIKKKRQNWWENNKKKVWNVMMCHYTGTGKTSTSCPSHDNIDEEDQFLRWLTEWAQYFCKEKVEEVKELITKCKSNISTNQIKTMDQIKDTSCTELRNKYYNWRNNRQVEWENLSEKYKNDKKNNGKYKEWPSTADSYVKLRCPDCDCTFEELEKLYGKNQDEQQFVKTLIKQNTINQNQKQDTSSTKNVEPPPVPPPAPGPAPPVLPDSGSNPGPNPSHPGGTTPSQPPTPSETPILSSTLPVGIGVVLGSIALLFFMK